MLDSFDTIRKKYRISAYICLFIWLAISVCAVILSGVSIIAAGVFIGITALSYLCGISVMIQYNNECKRLSDVEEVNGGEVIR